MAGGPAFPVDITTNEAHGWSPGMTLRDYFAGQILANSTIITRSSSDISDYVRLAYEFANAMLKEREK